MIALDTAAAICAKNLAVVEKHLRKVLFAHRPSAGRGNRKFRGIHCRSHPTERVFIHEGVSRIDWSAQRRRVQPHTIIPQYR